MKNPHLPMHGQAGGNQSETSAHLTTADLACSAGNQAGALSLELLAIHRRAIESGWGSDSYLAVADCVQRHRPQEALSQEALIIARWRRFARGLGVAL
jgi:hypothetical protein